MKQPLKNDDKNLLDMRKKLLNERFPSGFRKDIASRNVTNLILSVFGTLCYCVAAFMIAYSIQQIVNNERIQQGLSHEVTQYIKTSPRKDEQERVALAKRYNSKIPSITVRGDVINPETGQYYENEDKDYQKALNINGSGAIGVVRIPKISVEQTLYHGTLSDTLSMGIGHVYGTALPIGEPSTLSSIAAHSGGVLHLMFSRLPELQVGDYIYMDVLEEETGYQIIAREIVNPEDMAARTTFYEKKAKKEHTGLLWLNCCYPIGVNTQRFVVVAQKKSIPKPIPPSYTQEDVNMKFAYVGVIVFIILMIIYVLYKVVYRQIKVHKRLKEIDRELGGAIENSLK